MRFLTYVIKRLSMGDDEGNAIFIFMSNLYFLNRFLYFDYSWQPNITMVKERMLWTRSDSTCMNSDGLYYVGAYFFSWCQEMVFVSLGFFLPFLDLCMRFRFYKHFNEFWTIIYDWGSFHSYFSFSEVGWSWAIINFNYS